MVQLVSEGGSGYCFERLERRRLVREPSPLYVRGWRCYGEQA